MIVCCGEALIDFVPSADGRSYKPCPGGSILNMASGLGRMKVPVQFLCPISTDFFGDILANHLVNNGVDISLCPRMDGQTTLAFVSLPKEGAEEPQFAFYSNNAVDRNLTSDQLPEEFNEEVKAIHFGSISLVLEPGASSYGILMKRESRKRILTLDPNVRPAVIDNKNSYLKKFKEWVSYVDILRLSDADFEYLYPDNDIKNQLSTWFAMGINLVILTQGANGSRAFSSKGINIFMPGQKVKVKDTVGAGDTFFSAALAFLYEKDFLDNRSRLAGINSKDLEACLAFATKAAAINCTREGADPPYRHEMYENEAS